MLSISRFSLNKTKPVLSLSLFQVKTHSSDALLFYNSGSSASKQDFVAMEVRGGVPRMVIDQVNIYKTKTLLFLGIFFVIPRVLSYFGFPVFLLEGRGMGSKLGLPWAGIEPRPFRLWSGCNKLNAIASRPFLAIICKILKRTNLTEISI